MITCSRCGVHDIPDTAPGCPRCGLTFAGVQPTAPEIVSEELERTLRRDLGGQYQVGELLGRGGMSLVYHAHEAELSRDVALKVLPLQFIHTPDTVRRFEREAKIAASLDHPHIVPIYRVGATGTFLWYSMKLVKGRSLSEIINRQGALPLEQVIAIVEQVGSALQYAHRHGVVHRDVKPAIVMVEESGWVLVCDFGVARAFGSVALTQTGSSIGTPHYMSPEQFESRTIDGRSDQYSLAIMTYEALTGKVPFTGDSLGELVRKHLLENPPRVTADRPEVPEPIADALERAMSKQREGRFRDTGDFVQALGGRAEPKSPLFTGGRKGSGPSPVIMPEWQPARARRWGLMLWTVPLVLAAGAVGWAAFGRRPSAPSGSPSAQPARGDSGRRSTDTSHHAGPTAVVTTPAPPPKGDSQRARSRGAGGPPNPPPPRRRAAATPPPDSGIVLINSQPVATVRVDGRLVGTTPIPRLKLSIGEPHRVRLEQDGFVPFDTVITLRPGEQQKRLTNLTLRQVRP
jgi:serine/threonine protein kinase